MSLTWELNCRSNFFSPPAHYSLLSWLWFNWQLCKLAKKWQLFGFSFNMIHIHRGYLPSVCCPEGGQRSMATSLRPFLCIFAEKENGTWWGIIFRNGRRVHRFILCQNYMMFLLVLKPPPRILRLNIAYLRSARVAVARYRWFVLFM